VVVIFALKMIGE